MRRDCAVGRTCVMCIVSGRSPIGAEPPPAGRPIFSISTTSLKSGSYREGVSAGSPLEAAARETYIFPLAFLGGVQKVLQDVAFVRQADDSITESRNLHELRLLAQCILSEAGPGKVWKHDGDAGKPNQGGALHVEILGNARDDVRADSRGFHFIDDHFNPPVKGPVEEDIPRRCQDRRKIPSTFDLNWGSFRRGLINTWGDKAEGTTP